MGSAPENQVRTGLAAGGKWIRTLGPSRLILGEEKGRRSIRVVAKDAVPFHGGTSGSNPVCSASQSVLTGAFRGCRRKRPGFRRSVGLDETRERDVLATSRLALAAFL